MIQLAAETINCSRIWVQLTIVPSTSADIDRLAQIEILGNGSTGHWIQILDTEFDWPGFWRTVGVSFF